jgi:hypothetical protein
MEMSPPRGCRNSKPDVTVSLLDGKQQRLSVLSNPLILIRPFSSATPVDNAKRDHPKPSKRADDYVKRDHPKPSKRADQYVRRDRPRPSKRAGDAN